MKFVLTSALFLSFVATSAEAQVDNGRQQRDAAAYIEQQRAREAGQGSTNQTPAREGRRFDPQNMGLLDLVISKDLRQERKAERQARKERKARKKAGLAPHTEPIELPRGYRMMPNGDMVDPDGNVGGNLGPPD